MAPKKSPEKGASPSKKTKQSPSKARQSPPKTRQSPSKARQSPSKARAAALEAEVATAEPSKRVTRTPPPKKQSPAAKTSLQTKSPSKITKTKSPAKSATKANASPAKPKDDRFRGPPNESSRGYKSKDSIEDIIKAIDGRRLTKLDKVVVEAIHDLEEAVASGDVDDQLHSNTALSVVAKIEYPYTTGDQAYEKVHFNIYWRFRKLIEKVNGKWPDSQSNKALGQGSLFEMGDTDDDDDDSQAGGVDDDAEVTSLRRGASGPTRARYASTATVSRGSHPTGGVYSDYDMDGRLAREVEKIIFKKTVKLIESDPSLLPSHGSYSKLSPQALDKATIKGFQRAIQAANSDKLQKILREHANHSGQPKLVPQVSHSGLVIPPSSTGLKPKNAPAAPKTPKSGPSINQGTPSPQKPADPHQADIERQQRDAKRQADVEARKALIAKAQPYPRTEKNTLLPYASRRGNIVSSTNPGTISIVIGKSATGSAQKQERINPFFETLPGPEVWHRNMPPFFSFGETKLMEQIISDQINKDLARTHDELPSQTKAAATGKAGEGFLSKASKMMSWGKSTQQPAVEDDSGDQSEPEPVVMLRKDQWALPPLTEAERRAVLAEVKKSYPNFTGKTLNSPGKKRTSAESQQSPRKRQR